MGNSWHWHGQQAQGSLRCVEHVNPSPTCAIKVEGEHTKWCSPAFLILERDLAIPHHLADVLVLVMDFLPLQSNCPLNHWEWFLIFFFSSVPGWTSVPVGPSVISFPTAGCGAGRLEGGDSVVNMSVSLLLFFMWFPLSFVVQKLFNQFSVLQEKLIYM